MDSDSLSSSVAKFNVEVAKLVERGFSAPKTPNESRQQRNRDYTPLANVAVPFIDFIAAGQGQLPISLSDLSAESIQALRLFANRVGVIAVRENNGGLISKGLIAVTLLGDVDDTRDLTISLAVLHACALKLALDPTILFANASMFSPSPVLRDLVGNFPSRPEVSRSLGAFFLKEQDAPYDIVQERSLDNLTLLLSRNPRQKMIQWRRRFLRFFGVHEP